MSDGSLVQRRDFMRRRDIVYMFIVTNSDPNQNPDTKMPRVDEVTRLGRVTDVCMKSKLRELMKQRGATLYIERNTVLEEANKKIYNLLGIPQKIKKPRKPKKGKKGSVSEVTDEAPAVDFEQDAKLKKAMCEKYDDLRLFGGVPCSEMYPIGSIHGPVQLSNAISVNEIGVYEDCITRGAKASDEGECKANKTMGRRALVRFGLYVCSGSISGVKAAQTGMTEKDVDALWENLQMMWNDDRSSARSDVRPVGLFVFTHTTALGNCLWQDNADRVKITLKDPAKEPLSIDDYNITVDDTNMPKGVTVERKF